MPSPKQILSSMKKISVRSLNPTQLCNFCRQILEDMVKWYSHVHEIGAQEKVQSIALLALPSTVALHRIDIITQVLQKGVRGWTWLNQTGILLHLTKMPQICDKTKQTPVLCSICTWMEGFVPKDDSNTSATACAVWVVLLKGDA
jgi:hypothetical protein